MKKTLATAVLALTAAGIVAASSGAIAPARAEEQKTADIYILAGQSNAVGCSNLSQTVHGQSDAAMTYESAIAADDARNKSGYNNVLYYGVTNVDAKAQSIPSASLVSVKLGQGQNAQFMGPEVGMAKILSETHTEEHPAVIIKYAAGGVYLGDYNGAFGAPYLFTEQYGNWASPTILARWKEEGKKIHKNSGLMYTRFLEVLERGLGEVRAQGYTPVIKGYIWMQGESDAEHKELSADYGKNLRDLIGDMRSAVAELTEDENARHMPFVVGKITPTYNGYTKWVETLRTNQETVAKTVPFVSTVETDDLPVVDMKTQETLGSDVCHFNAGDMYTLGKRFATSAQRGVAKYAFTVTAGEGGSVEMCSVLSDGAEIGIIFTPEEGKVLARVLCNDKDITNDIKRTKNTFNWKPVSVSAFNEIVLEFQDKEPEPDLDQSKPIEEPIRKGCSSSVGFGVVAAGGVLAAVAVCAKKKKK
ncbi:MAG: sialate O-acetylesterase [Clostridia bacterium]|nr:sialate O-acetylesterase [Clostridia bacterium]